MECNKNEYHNAKICDTLYIYIYIYIYIWKYLYFYVRGLQYLFLPCKLPVLSAVLHILCPVK